MEIRNVIFDLDGTLLDTSAGIIESVKYTAEKLGLPALSEQEYLSFIGPPLRRSFTEIYGCTEDAAQEATRVFRAFYQKGAVLHAVPYDGITELCRMLHGAGIRMGVATNKPERFAVRLIRKNGLDRLIHPVCGADENGTLRKADLVRLCMEKMNGNPSDTVLVGDSVNDAAGAEEAGVFFAAVTYGFGFRSPEDIRDYPCIGTADSPAALWKIIGQYNGKGGAERYE